MIKPKKIDNIKLGIGQPKNNLKLFKFNSNDFSTKIGNNFVPGKYSDLELYCMNLISERELISRKIDEYQNLLDDKIISEDDFIKRTTNPIEISREIKNVKRYYELENDKVKKDYFTGEVFPYTIDSIKDIADTVRNSANFDNKYQGLFIIITTLDDITKIYKKANDLINYFTEFKNNKNPYNFFAATEGLASFSYNIEIEKINNFTDEDIDTAFNTFKSDYTKSKSFLTRNNLKIEVQDNIVVLKCSNNFFEYFRNNFYNDYIFRLGFQKLFLNKFDYDIDFITITTYPSVKLPFIFVNTSSIKEGYKGSITLSNYENIYNGPMLHEIVHYFCNRIIEGQSCVVHKYQIDIPYNDKKYEYLSYGKEYPNSSILGPHWGFTNTPGQLGGFNENMIEEITNNTNYPISITDIEIETTINDIENIDKDENQEILDTIIKDNNDINEDNILDDQIIENDKIEFSNFTFSFKIENVELDDLTVLDKINLKKNIDESIRNYFDISSDKYINIILESGSINVTIEIKDIEKEKGDILEDDKNIIPEIIQNNLLQDEKLNQIINKSFITNPEVNNTDVDSTDVDSTDVDTTDVYPNDNDNQKDYNYYWFKLIIILVIFIFIIIIYFILK